MVDAKYLRLVPRPEDFVWFDARPRANTFGRAAGYFSDQTLVPLPYPRIAVFGRREFPEDRRLDMVIVLELFVASADARLARCTVALEAHPGIEPTTVEFVIDAAWLSGWLAHARAQAAAGTVDMRSAAEAEARRLYSHVVTAVVGGAGEMQQCAPNPANAKRVAKGKKPLYDWHTVAIEPPRTASPYRGGTHASPRPHDRRGHYRTYKSGKRVWIANARVGSGPGFVFKDYVVSPLTN